MTLYNGLIQNLLQGVSQQSRLERRPEQLESQVNCLSSVTAGLGNRQGTQILVHGSTSDYPTDAAYHEYDRGTDEQYSIVVKSGAIKVTDLLTGTDKTVDLNGHGAYLTSSDPESDFKFHSVADTTILLNSSIKPTMGTATEPDTTKQAIIYCKTARYGMTYTIKSGSTLIAECTTASTVTVSTTLADKTVTLQTTDVLDCLYTGATVGLATWNATGTFAGGLSAYATANFDAKEKSENIIYLADLSDMDLEVTDSNGGDDLITFGNTVDVLGTLPRVAYHGYKVKVEGIDNTEYNDYYVTFEADSGSGMGKGIWKESAGFGVNTTFTPTTMPHTLTPNAARTVFTLNQIPWVARTAGDDLTNPVPSFVGNEISDLVTYQGRLVFLSEENRAASVTFDHYNFFAETVTQESPADPLDMASADNEVTKLHNALVFDSSLLIFSDRAQFLHPSALPFTTASTGLSSKTRFKNIVTCPPVASATSIFFPYQTGQYTSVRELQIEKVTGNVSARDVSAHIDHYIPGTAAQMVSSSDYNILIVRPGNDPTALYVYQWFYQDGKKRQSAWHKWDFGYNILHMSILQNRLYLWKAVGTVVSVEYIDIASSNTTGVAFPVRLDHHGIVTATSDSDYWKVDVTPWTSTRGLDRDDLKVIAGDDTGIEGSITVYEDHPTDANAFRILKSTLVSVGTPDFIVGCTIHAIGELTNPYVRSQNGTPLTKTPLRLGSCKFNCSNTGQLDVVVEKDHSPTYTKEYNARIIDGGFTLDEPPTLLDVEITAPIRSDATRCRVKFESESHLPFNITSIDWSGDYHETGRRTV